jgi:hypothetical protein
LCRVLPTPALQDFTTLTVQLKKKRGFNLWNTIFQSAMKVNLTFKIHSYVQIQHETINIC